MSTTNTNRIALSEILAVAARECDRHGSAVLEGDTIERLAQLEAALARVTAQRDQCREALEELVAEHDRDATEAVDATPGLGWPNETCGMVLARAALRACDEKRSEASIAEGGVL